MLRTNVRPTEGQAEREISERLSERNRLSPALTATRTFASNMLEVAEMRKMSAHGHTPPDGFVNNEPADEVVNDSLGTVDSADNSGTDSEEEAAKAGKGAGRDPAAHDKSEVAAERP